METRQDSNGNRNGNRAIPVTVAIAVLPCFHRPVDLPALAVGIVLRAGPLKGDLGTRLTQETTALRADKADLRTQLDAEKRGTAARDSFSSAVAPVIMKGQLTGKTVALVIAPGADSDLVKNTTASLVAAGAKVGSTITLTDAWADPAKRTFRNTLADQLAELVKAPLVSNNPDELAATVLARAILGGKDQATERVAPAASAALDRSQGWRPRQGIP